MTDTEKLDSESAEIEFMRFTDAMDLDVDPADMDDDDRRGFEQQKNRIVRAIQSGAMIINDNGEPVFNPSDGGDAIVFHEPTGASIMAMDGVKKGHDVKRMYKVMGDMTKQPPARFSNMKNRDLKICLAVVTVFLG